MKYVMTYRAVEDFLPLAQQNYPAHSARVDEFARRGDLLMVGTFDEPMNGEAMGVFTTLEGRRGVHRRRPLRAERRGRLLGGAAVARGAAALTGHPDG